MIGLWNCQCRQLRKCLNDPWIKSSLKSASLVDPVLASIKGIQLDFKVIFPGQVRSKLRQSVTYHCSIDVPWFLHVRHWKRSVFFVRALPLVWTRGNSFDQNDRTMALWWIPHKSNRNLKVRSKMKAWNPKIFLHQKDIFNHYGQQLKDREKSSNGECNKE